MIRTLVASLFGLLILMGTAQAQPAPALTSVRAYAARSTGHLDWDYIPNGGFATTSPGHSGPELVVVTFEQGYSASQQAKFNGRSMSLIRTEPYPSRGPIQGYYRYWYISTPFTSGQFTYSAVSIRTFRTFSTFANIR